MPAPWRRGSIAIEEDDETGAAKRARSAGPRSWRTTVFGVIYRSFMRLAPLTDPSIRFAFRDAETLHNRRPATT
jgi:hypothetical protein